MKKAMGSAGLNSGIYFLRIISDRKAYSGKFAK